ncbi:unnamed protein product [Clonostachys rhizophaga]|uniref:2-dehydropantoate 2-reductase n=1 Tax=Clonostachys rhizophaga TaxID=160324 RepID=A0A9N9YBQ4_9HYPO|nr:unnamed protein product [Clonostachys rhizophaga]
MAQSKANVLIIGSGGVGTMAAYALEIGGRAEVTAVLRSNFEAVVQKGFDIDSLEHGHDIKGWRPTHIRRTIPNVAEEELPAFDYIVVTTKNIPEVPPSVEDLIAPAVTPGKTAIVLSQNGLNIERPIISRFSTSPIISSISLINVAETSHGTILHDDNDVQFIGPFISPVKPEIVERAAKEYISLYNACGILRIEYEHDVQFTRWQKLVYNSSYNTVSAALQMDTIRMRKSMHVIDELVRPIMLEIVAAAKAAGYELPHDIVQKKILNDPIDVEVRPSMMQDVSKGNFIEIENIVHQPLLEGTSRGVPMPTLQTVYYILKGFQRKTMEKRGLWEPAFTPDNPYR